MALSKVIMLLILFLLPLLSFVLLFLLRERANAWAGWLAQGTTLVDGAVVLILWKDFTGSSQVYDFQWVSFQKHTFTLSFQIDNLSLLMLALVLLVAWLVQIYSMSYMAKDAALWRYFAFLQLFIF